MAGPERSRGEQPDRGSAPWGSVAAFVMACVATLAGVVRQLDPDVILIRAVIASVFGAAAGSVGGVMMAWFSRSK